MSCLCADPACRKYGCKAERHHDYLEIFPYEKPQTGHYPVNPGPKVNEPVGRTPVRLDEQDIDRIADKLFNRMKEFFSGR